MNNRKQSSPHNTHTNANSLLLSSLCFLILLPFQLDAETYLKWHDIVGRSFESKIINASAQRVRLENRTGKQIDFPIADLKPSSKEHVFIWQEANQKADTTDFAAATEQNQGPPSAFDNTLFGNLVCLDGKTLKRCSDATQPKKYYLLYYTASWCGPCQRFTPSLVDWYEKNKNENFELVLISSDSNEEAMEQYSVSKKVPWPQLKLKETKGFKKQHKHGVRGIPSLIVCDIDGENLGNFRSKLDELSKLVK